MSEIIEGHSSSNVDPEKSVIQGVRDFSCVRDDFGLVMISGQYNNDNVKRSQVNLVISFFDNEENSIGKSTATFYNLKEFETKRFMGHSKWNGDFYTCQIDIE